MSKRRMILLSSVLGVAFLVSVIFGAYYAREAFRARDQLENGYTRRLMESREHLQQMSLKLSKIPAASEAATLIDLLSSTSIRAESLVSGLSALPLSHAAMEEAIAFSNQVSEYTLLLSLKLAAGQPLSQAELQILADLCSQCRLLEGQFALAWNTMLENSMRLTGRENVFYQEAAAQTRPMEMAGDSIMAYPSMIYDGAYSDGQARSAPRALGQNTVDEAEAIRLAIQYIGEERVKEAVHGADVAGHLPCYGVSVTLVDGTTLNVAITKQGGQLLWMMPEHAEFPASLTLEECRASAQQFLEAHGYGPVESAHFQVYDGLAVISFAPLDGEVLLYPDLIKVQVRMDTGEVVGLEAHEYLLNHGPRQNLSPVITPEEASAVVGDHLTDKNVRLCLIPHRGRERLCYEVRGQLEGQDYRIYVDALTGHEVEVLLMVDTLDGQLSV